MTDASPAYVAPQVEQWHELSACHDSELAVLFTADDPDDLEKAAMRAICAACPVLAECQEAITCENPGFGFWAGQFLGGEIPPVLMESPRHRPLVFADLGEPVDWRDSIRTSHVQPSLRPVPNTPAEGRTARAS